MTDDYVPVMLGDRLIGKMKIDLVTGEYSGTFDPDFTEIVNEGLKGQVLQVVLVGNSGFPRAVNAQQELKEYLESEKGERNHEVIALMFDSDGETTSVSNIIADVVSRAYRAYFGEKMHAPLGFRFGIAREIQRRLNVREYPDE